MTRVILTTLALCFVWSSPTSAQMTEYLSDRPDLRVHAQQGWGLLGIDQAAHARKQTGPPLKIAGKAFEKGFGTHAPGKMIIDLNGRFTTFEAKVGVQTQPTNGGSVVFEVYVDGNKVFDSGIMRSADKAKPISVSVAGARELRLIVTDAGDGFTCDMANWAEASLVCAPTVTHRNADSFDVGRFARIVTSDPGRFDGARRKRTQEFLEKDLYLDTDVFPDEQGRYIVPVDSDGFGVIGLRWIERRHVRSLAIEFAGEIDPARAENANIQYWTGESPYQGQWMPLNGILIAQPDRWSFRIDGRQDRLFRNGTWKIRWIFPPGQTDIVVTRLLTWTSSVIKTIDLNLQLESADPSKQVELEMYNGEFIEPAEFAGAIVARMNAAKFIPLKVRYIDRRSWQCDRAVLRIRRPEGDCAVAIDDVLAQKVVYIPSKKVMVSPADVELTPAIYREAIEDKETVLEQVRKLPDQTRQQAIEKLHSDVQDTLPTLLSLACDNIKYIAHRDGTILFAPPNPDKPVAPRGGKWPCQMKLAYGSGKNEKIARHIEDGWYPIQTTTIQDDGITYGNCSFVAPSDRQAPREGNEWLNPKPLFVGILSAENNTDASAEASISLEFTGDLENKKSADVHLTGQRAFVIFDGQLMAAIEPGKNNPFKLTSKKGTLKLKSQLAPKQKTECTVYLPGWKLAPADHATLTGGAAMVADCKAYWDRVLAEAMQVQVPDPLITNTIKASQVHCLIAARNEESAQRIAPWIASIYYGPLESESHSIIRGMGFFGHHEFVRRSLDFFISKYDPAGFLTTGYTTMGTGWHLWTLGEHYLLARDADWLKSRAEQITKVCNWVMAQRKKTCRPKSDGTLPPEAGLMPPGVLADWDVFAFYFYLNGYYCAGLRDAGKALVDIGVDGADKLVKDAEALKKDILRAYRQMQTITPVLGLHDGTFVTPYPTQLLPGPTALFFPGEDGNRSWCYDVELGSHHLVPFGILPPDSQEVREMMDHMEDVQFLSDGWFDYPAEQSQKDPFNFGGFAKVQPYYARTAEVYALRDNVKPFVRSYFNALATLINLENNSLQEHFHGVGAWNKTHETGYFLHQSRIMLVMERGNELWLTPLVTDRWFEDGQTIEVNTAPTFFGPVSYRIESHTSAGRIDATIEPPTRSTPKQIVLRFRHPEGKAIRKVIVNGEDHTTFDATGGVIRLEPAAKTIRVKAEY